MKETVFQWFLKRCRELGVEIEDYQYYVNECEKYELKSTEDMQLMCSEIINHCFYENEDFNVSFKNTDNTHIILLHIHDD